ncbi:DNA gyrase subunit A, partial [gut metagenome]
KNGMAIRFSEQDARPMGRLGHGVRAIRLDEGDTVVGVGILREGASVFTVTEQGKGRCTPVEDYRIQGRGGKGIRNYTNGGVAGIKVLDVEDDIILISQEGIIIRMHAQDINSQSRYASGVRVMRIAEGDRVVTVARTEQDETKEVEKPEIEDGEEELTDEQRAALEAEEAMEAETSIEEEPMEEDADESEE